VFDNISTFQNEYHSQVSDYVRNEVMTLTPNEIILKLYDFAILNLKKSQSQKALRAITELIVSLNFDYKDFSLNLYRLYQYSRERIIQGRPDEALVILEGLRESWAKAFNLKF
jgi:flagellar secretion chaperone FliS